MKNNKEIGWLLKEKYPHDQKISVRANKDIERLKKGEPLDYVIGFTKFLGCKIDLSKKPLIPRPETEFWAEQAIEAIKKAGGRMTSPQCLDIFAGSGCIGIAVLKHIRKCLPAGRQAKCDFFDIDKNNLKQIKINLKINGVGVNSIVRQSDVFKNVGGRYDYIFANPPYIAITRKNKIQKTVLKFEPKQALFGGKDGLFYIRKFLKSAKNYLNKNGRIYMEFDYIQRKRIEELIKKYKYSDYKFNKDQYGKWRFVMIK